MTGWRGEHHFSFLQADGESKCVACVREEVHYLLHVFLDMSNEIRVVGVEELTNECLEGPRLCIETSKVEELASCSETYGDTSVEEQECPTRHQR